MPIYVHRYNGDHSTRSYNLDEKKDRTALKSYITGTTNKALKDTSLKSVAIKKLKYIAISTRATAEKKRCLRHAHVSALQAHVLSSLRKLGASISNDEYNLDPEELFSGLSVAESKAAGDTVKRDTTTYKDNVTVSLAAPKHVPKVRADELDHEDVIIARVEAYQKQIVEHAKRRVHFFWLLCVAYYRTGLVIDADQGAMTQHGRASNGLAACHSAILVNPCDNTPAKYGASLINGTSLKDTLNSTVALPIAVNKCDSNMESEGKKELTMRYQANQILNRVSQGLSPIDAMSLFFGAMLGYFTRAKDTFAKKADREAPTQAKIKVLAYQMDGTFHWAAKTNKPGVLSLSIAALMLLLNRYEKEGTPEYIEVRDRLMVDNDYREACIREVQKEILTPILSVAKR